MNRILSGLLGLALSGCAAFSEAGTLADLSIVDRTSGQRLQTWVHQGRIWIAGTPGNKYAVAINNRSGRRVMTVVSVDGINVVTGESAAPEQNGYVLDRGMHYEIAGWRKSRSEVAAFFFTALPDSYAARTDRPDNVGVIAMAVYREWRPPVAQQPRPWSHADVLSESKAASRAEGAGSKNAPASAAASGELARAPRDERLGTGHGAREYSQVSYTHFRRASSHPNETLTIYYDSYANLVARGVIPAAPETAPLPNPFPAGTRFVPDPRG